MCVNAVWLQCTERGERESSVRELLGAPKSVQHLQKLKGFVGLSDSPFPTTKTLHSLSRLLSHTASSFHSFHFISFGYEFVIWF